MTSAQFTALGVGCMLVSWVLTGSFLRFAIRNGLLDVPNARSSHSVPTPRGGGVAIAVTVSLAAIVLASLDIPGSRGTLGIVAAGAAIALIGFLDDRGHVTRRGRLAVHILAAVTTLTTIGTLPTVAIGPIQLTSLPLLVILGALYIVWSINFTNFMDGIDGIAASYVIAVCGGGLLCASFAADGPPLTLPLMLGAATLGFLAFNWPPSRLFMGDVGSGYLGYIVAACSVLSAQRSGPLLWCWWILMGTFVVDATVTLVTRLLARQAVQDAHRTHAYQLLAPTEADHGRVTLAYLCVTMVWLLPLALLVATGRLSGISALTVAYAPLVAGALRVGAGRPASR